MIKRKYNQIRLSHQFGRIRTIDYTRTLEQMKGKLWTRTLTFLDWIVWWRITNPKITTQLLCH